MKTVKTVMVSLVVIALVACNGSSSKQSDEKLIGVWSGYLTDPDTGHRIMPMSIEFTSDFRMNYVLGEGDMQNTVSQSYHIEDDYIYGDPGTDEKVKYRIEEDKLILFTGNIINEFVKQE